MFLESTTKKHTKLTENMENSSILVQLVLNWMVDNVNFKTQLNGLLDMLIKLHQLLKVICLDLFDFVNKKPPNGLMDHRW